jgi:hypothetical protein
MAVTVKSFLSKQDMGTLNLVSFRGMVGFDFFSFPHIDVE